MSQMEELGNIEASFKKNYQGKELEDKMALVRDNRVHILEEEVADGRDFLTANQETLNILQRQRDTLEGIAQIYRSLPHVGEVGRAGAEINALRAQVTFGGGMEEWWANPANQEGVPTSQRESITKALREGTMEARAKLAQRLSPAAQAQARQMDQITLATQMASGQANSFEFGLTDAERLVNRREGLQSMISDKTRQMNDGSLSDLERQNARVMLMEHYRDLAETTMRIEMERMNITKQENQLFLERNREFEKSLLTAGPGDLLRKMAAVSIAFDPQGRPRPVTAGRFFALDPALRQDLMQVRPELSEEFRNLERGRRFLGGARSLSDLQAQHYGFGRRTTALGAGIAAGAGDAMSSTSLDWASQAVEASKFKEAIRGSALMVDLFNRALAGAVDKLDGLSGRSSWSMPAQSRGMAPGHGHR